MGQRKVETYKRDPQALIADFEKLEVELARLFGHVKQESKKKGEEEASETLPRPKRYVKYTQQYKNRITENWEDVERYAYYLVSNRLQTR